MPKFNKSSSDYKIRTDRCFKPFDLCRHRKVKNLRPVLEQNLVVLNLPVTKKSLQQKICSTCRLKFAELHKDGEKKVNFNNFNITYLF